MKEIRIYTWKLAEFLTGKGFQYKRMVQDVALVNYKNWIFEDSPEIRKAIQDYKKSRR